MQYFKRKKKQNRGVALLMVIFIIGLATTLVLGLTHSTFLQSRSIGMVERQLQAEYLLKSMFQFGMAVIETDEDPVRDTLLDNWAKGSFSTGAELPPAILSLLGIEIPGMSMALEIASLDSRIRIVSQNINVNSTTNDLTPQAKILLDLFQLLGFDNDNEKDTTDYFKGRVFNSQEMIVNLIDALDADQNGLSANNLPQGIEEQLPKDYLPNKADSANGGFSSLQQLRIIPGFTERRLQQLEPFVSLKGASFINFNLAPENVLKALHENIANDPNLLATILQRRIDPENPLTKNEFTDVLVDPSRTSQLHTVVGESTTWFQVIAWVGFGSNSEFFLRAAVQRSGNKINNISDLLIL